MSYEVFDNCVKKVENFSFNINTFIDEYYNIVKPNLETVDEDHLEYRLRCIWKGDTFPILEQCVETKKAFDILSKSFEINSVVWRVLMPKRTYQWHTDECECSYHLPVMTNPGSWFMYEGTCYHIPADGSIYKADTSKYHTFVNAGLEPRVHLIFANLKLETLKMSTLKDFIRSK